MPRARVVALPPDRREGHTRWRDENGGDAIGGAADERSQEVPLAREEAPVANERAGGPGPVDEVRTLAAQRLSHLDDRRAAYGNRGTCQHETAWRRQGMP